MNGTKKIYLGVLLLALFFAFGLSASAMEEYPNEGRVFGSPDDPKAYSFEPNARTSQTLKSAKVFDRDKTMALVDSGITIPPNSLIQVVDKQTIGGINWCRIYFFNGNNAGWIEGKYINLL